MVVINVKFCLSNFEAKFMIRYIVDAIANVKWKPKNTVAISNLLITDPGFPQENVF